MAITIQLGRLFSVPFVISFNQMARGGYPCASVTPIRVVALSVSFIFFLLFVPFCVQVIGSIISRKRMLDCFGNMKRSQNTDAIKSEITV